MSRCLLSDNSHCKVHLTGKADRVRKGKEMKRWRNLVPAAGLLLAVAVSVSAREWTDNTGTYKTEANLVEVRGNQVVLKKSNGQVISLPIDRLSKSDQEYLESLENLEPKPENAATAATETITNSIGMKLKLIPPGQFVMGSPASEEKREDGEEQHQVRITRGFYMGQTEVTQHQWLSVMRSRPGATRPPPKQDSFA